MFWFIDLLQNIFAAAPLVKMFLEKVAFSPYFRIAEYHLNQYESALEAFTQGHQLDGECSLFCFPDQVSFITLL